MTESALAKFTPEDIEMATNTAREALNNSPDDTLLNWSNSNTGHSGSVKVYDTRQVGETTCREVLFEHNAITIVQSTKYFVCQQADDRWQVTSRNN